MYYVFSRAVLLLHIMLSIWWFPIHFVVTW